MRLSREFFIPAAAVKVADKRSDAVAYIYESNGPCAAIFYGKQAKPVARFRYQTEASRAASVAAHFERRQQVAAYKAERRAAANKPRAVEVGAAYYTSWGYEQTNINFYEVVQLVGKASALVRPVATLDASDPGQPFMTGKGIPDLGNYTGEARLVRVNGDSFKVADHYASRWDGRPVNWTAYA